MGTSLSPCGFILGVLLISMSFHGSGARKMINCPEATEGNENTEHMQQHALDDDDDDHMLIKQKNGDQENHALEVHLPLHLDHMDPTLNVFFTLNDLQVGKTMTVYFSIKDPSTSPRLLSRKEANSIPFSLDQLPFLLELLSLSKDSPQAKAMEYTLTQCELEPMKGETKFCATSLESMLDFARATFGLDTPFKVLTTNHITKPVSPLHNYTILEEPKEILAHKMIGCHTMPYPYVVYYCHSQHGGNRLFEILLGGENGERVNAAGVCHMDTSHWDSDNVSFRVLNVRRGTSPVCHVFQADDMVWVPLLA